MTVTSVGYDDAYSNKHNSNCARTSMPTLPTAYCKHLYFTAPEFHNFKRRFILLISNVDFCAFYFLTLRFVSRFLMARQHN